MRLLLDLAHPRPRPSWIGWLLLGLGLLTAAWAGWRYQSEAARLGAARAELARLSPAPARAPRAAKAAQESALSGNARRALAADWHGLLAGLEAHRPAGIALLGVEADAAKGSLKLTANAKDLPAMLAYLATLESAGLRHARLDSHAAMEEEAQHYVRFSVHAEWGAGKASGDRP
ncbi:MAG: hypothetical protein AB1831_03770 [Pseudomonadota bacterium]